MKVRARVSEVEPGSLAEEAGIRQGDCLVTINGKPVRDLVDYRFLEADEELELEVERDGRRFRFQIEKDYDTGIGCRFVEATFDGIRRCANRCVFCFVDQLPPGLRGGLYIKDDDYRLSFLHGNFVTLTNLKEADWQRIEEQGLSPLYVSVHATNNDLRRKLLGNPKAPDILAQLRRLAGMGVMVHAQIVLSPGLNDGAALEQTVLDLRGLDNVESIGVVPVGLTAFCKPALARIVARDYALRRYTAPEAKEVLGLIAPLQKKFQAELGRTLVQASDEFYLLAGRTPPRATWYDGFPQLENGIGMVRRLLDDWSACKRRLRRSEDQEIRRGAMAATSGGDTEHTRRGGPCALPPDRFLEAGSDRVPLITGTEGVNTPVESPSPPCQGGTTADHEITSVQEYYLVGKKIALLTGTLAAPVLSRIARELAAITGVDAEVVAVENRFLGATVTVAGLLSGADLLAAARSVDPDTIVFIPRTALDAGGERFLDDMTLEEFLHAASREVYPAGFVSEVVEALM